MALLNTARLVRNATTIAELGRCANQVQKDPAVQKSCGEARDDVVRAAKSVGRAAVEVHSAWRRTSPRNSAFTGLHV